MKHGGGQTAGFHSSRRAIICPERLAPILIARPRLDTIHDLGSFQWRDLCLPCSLTSTIQFRKTHFFNVYLLDRWILGDWRPCWWAFNFRCCCRRRLDCRLSGRNRSGRWICCKSLYLDIRRFAGGLLTEVNDPVFIHPPINRLLRTHISTENRQDNAESKNDTISLDQHIVVSPG